MDNVRYNISPCLASEAKQFVEKLDNNVYAPRGIVMADEHSHYDRYSFLRGESKVAVVYDTSAQVISITASQEYADELLDIFRPSDFQTIKRSTVPAQGSQRAQYPNPRTILSADGIETRAKIFSSPVTERRRPSIVMPTVIATAKGAEISTDEIYPPQRAKKRVTNNTDAIAMQSLQSDNGVGYSRIVKDADNTVKTPVGYKPLRPDAAEQTKIHGLNISAAIGSKTAPRRATISFGDEDDYQKKSPALVKKPSKPFGSADASEYAQSQNAIPDAPKRRGRPPKAKSDQAVADIYVPEYKNGYAVKSVSDGALTDLLNTLKTDGAKIAVDAGVGQDVSYTVSAVSGQKAMLRYSSTKGTLSLQGKPSELFGKIMTLMSASEQAWTASDRKSGKTPVNALADKSKNTVAGDTDKKPFEDKMLRHRLPTAYEYLSEQSRIDFSYGLHDFSKRNLQLSDYSVLLVPPFRGLERFVFDLQRAEGIKVKMIGQAYDKNDQGKYILKNGYQQRINSVVYAEVMVALYTEYFSQRNFFAHSDNSDDNLSRSLSDRNSAKTIFDHLLSVVEYNAKKLKEIGFKMDSKD